MRSLCLQCLLRDDIPEVDDEGQDNPIDEGMQEDTQLDDDAPF